MANEESPQVGVLTVKPGTLLDYVTQQPVRDTPEEREAVQPFLQELVENYGYSKGQIKSHPQHRVRKSPSDKKGLPIDIAVFRTEDKREEDLFLVVECKRKTRRDGLRQLKDYLLFSDAEIGVWFNGDERAFIRKVFKNGRPDFDDLPAIPRKGQSLDEIGRFKKADLRVPHNLKTVFKSIRNHLAGNAVGTTRDETLAEQLINIIFCKLFDERFAGLNDMLEFRTSLSDTPEQVAARITNLFDKVKARYADVFDKSDAITIDPASLQYIVGELQGLSLLRAERDVVADAFETFIGPALKGAQGQFFTPRNVIQLLVALVDPQSNEVVIDPSCGSGGFLVESLRHIWAALDSEAERRGWSERELDDEKRRVADRSIRGIERDQFLSKVAKAYLVILGDGHSSLFCEDTLDLPQHWSSATRNAVKIGTFDVVLANPPFGKDIKVVGEEKLSQFQLAYKWSENKLTGLYERTDKLQDGSAPQILFVERCLQLLKSGGRLGIVLPESFFHAPDYRFVLQLLQKHNITWVVDLPHNTFRPHNNAKCVMLVVEKDRPQGEIIRMAVAEQMGHDHRGERMGRWDLAKNAVNDKQLWDDLPLIAAESRGAQPPHYTFDVPSATAATKKVYVPRYYWRATDKAVEEMALREGLDLVPFGDLVDRGIITWFDGHGSPPAEAKARGTYPYVRVKDILNWEVFHNPTSMIPKEFYDELRKNQAKDLKTGDVLYVKRGSYRIGSVAIASPHDLEVALTREILVFRAAEENDLGIDGYYLLYMLSSEVARLQTPGKVLMDTTMPNIANRWRDLRLPLHRDPQRRKAVAQQIKAAIEDKWSAEDTILKLRETLTGVADETADTEADEAA